MTAAQNEAALNYLRVRGLYALAVIFEATILYTSCKLYNTHYMLYFIQYTSLFLMKIPHTGPCISDFVF